MTPQAPYSAPPTLMPIERPDADLPIVRYPTFERTTKKMTLGRDTWLIFRRSVILTLRQPTWLFFGIMYPVLYLVLFGPLLDGAVSQSGAGVSAYNWFVPGLLVQVALFGSAFVGFGLIAELRSGVVERMRVTPMSRAAMLLGRSLRDVVLLLLQALIMVVLALPFGLHLDPAGLAVSFGVLALVALVMSPLSYAAGLILKSEDAFAPVVQSLVMPLLLLSGILLPMALAPDWLKFLSTINPLTHAVDAVRALFNGDWGNPEVAIGATITATLAVVAVWIGARTFSRANA
jgi:ABC-2 type transport system permease protein